MTRMGRAIRYVPYPVVGGFLGATGLLILLGAIRVITGHRLQFATLDQFANLLTVSELSAACAMALVLYLTWHRSRTSFGLPAILIGGVIFAHVAFWLVGISSAEAQASGWTFQPPPKVNFMLPWSMSGLRDYPWYAVPDLLGNVIAVIFVTATSTLFNTTGIEVATQREANLERELNVTGLANMLSGAFGGLYRLHFRQPHRAQLQRRRNRPAIGPDRRGDLGADAVGGARAIGLYAEIRARRPLDLSGCGPAAPMDHSVAAAAVDYRISFAAGDHRHHRAVGLHRRHPDRRRDRLRDLCAERRAHRFHQIQFRRLGISQFAGSLA
jgi:hypothetical protein